MRRDRVILELRAKLVPDLLVNGVDNFLARKHIGTYRGLRGCKRIEIAHRKNKKPDMLAHAGYSVLATSYSRTACRSTTIEAAAFHCRVRNGYRWGHGASATRNLRPTCRRKSPLH